MSDKISAYIYCIRCKENTLSINLKQDYVGINNNVPIIRSNCFKCDSKKVKRGYLKRDNDENKVNDTFKNPSTGFSGYNLIAKKSDQNQEFVSETLNKNETFSLHKPVMFNFQRLRVLVCYIDEQWQADLVDMRHLESTNRHYNYLLTCIDCFSKYAWAIPLKTKTAIEIVKAFNSIVNESSRKPCKLQTDRGKEFYNSEMKDFCLANDIKHFSSENYDIKACIVERFNRTLKQKMWKYFTDRKTKDWISVIDELLDNYNNSFHRSIKMTPIEGSKVENTEIVFKNLFPRNEVVERTEPYFKVGNTVRVLNKKKIFEKGYTPNWSNQLYRISRVNYTIPYTYRVNEFKKLFYQEELNLVSE